MNAVSSPTLLRSTASDSAASAAPKSAADLSSDDFFKLLITQILNQDPLQPTSNEDLLKQISSIREIQLSSTLTDSLQKLSGQQQIGSASGMIGQYVTSLPKGDGSVDRGLVVAVRFVDGGKPALQLSNGISIALDQVGRIEPPQQAAQSLIGQTVMGIDQPNKSAPKAVDGIVTSTKVVNGEQMLELDNGNELRLRDLLSVAASAVATS
jgi:flagellar basal-body rod modification protein FlgD